MKIFNFKLNLKPRHVLSDASDNIKKIKRYNEYASKHEIIYVRIVAVLMLLIAVSLSAGLFFARLSVDIKANDNALRLGLDTIKQRILLSDTIVSEEYDSLYDFIGTETTLAKLNLETTPREEWVTAIDLLTDPEDNAEFYYVENMSESFGSSNAGGLGLSRDELSELCANGILTLTTDEGIQLYGSTPIYNGYLVTMYRDIGKLTGLNARNSLNYSHLFSEGYGVILYDTETGYIHSGEEQILTLRNIRDADMQAILNNSVDINTSDADYNIFRLLHELNSYRLCSEDIEDDFRITVYYSIRDCFVNVLSDVFLPIVYILLAAFVLVVSASVLRLVRSAVRAESEIVRLGRRLALDKLIAKRMLSLFGIVAVIVTIILIYVSALSEISRQNLEASSDLSDINDSEALAKEEYEAFEGIRDDYTTFDLDKAAKLLEGNEALRSNDMLKEIADSMKVCSEITIFDQSGFSVASSGGYIGYPLTGSGEYGEELYEVLSATVNSYLTPPDENDISYYAIKCRYNSGLIRFTIKNDMFKDVLYRLGGSSVMIEADFGNADVVYYHSEHPDTLYFAKAGEQTTSTIPNTLDENALQDKYFGIRKINGTKYLINVASDPSNEGNFFIDALDMRYIFNSITNIIISFIVCLIMLLMPVLFFFVPFRLRHHSIITVPKSDIVYDDTDEATADTERNESSESEPDRPERDNEKLLLYRSGIEYSEQSFVRSMNHIMGGCALLFIAYLLFGIITNNTTGSLVSYLFSSNWQRGLNIFSLTISVIIIFGVWAVSLTLRKLISIVSQNAGPSGVTAYKLIESFIRFAALLATVIWVLSELGVKTGSILAGAGLTSVVIGIGAQSTVSNVLTGLFIIFEGNFNVGDIVDINGWVGRIKEIGVRSTCVESYGNSLDYRNIRVINNSDFNNIVNRSINPSRAVADIFLPIYGDDKRVRQLVMSNAEQVKSTLIEPLSDIKCWGITSYTETYKVMRFTVSTDEQNRGDNQRLMLSAIAKLLEPDMYLLDRADNTIRFVTPAEIYVHKADDEGDESKTPDQD